MRDYVAAVGANFGRVRVIKLEPQDRDTAIRSIHRDDNNRFNPEGDGWVVRSWLELTDNPDSYMLLMDNGPDGLSRAQNDGLYSAEGLAAARAALIPGGLLAVWSAAGDPAFTRRLDANGFVATATQVRARANGNALGRVASAVVPDHAPGDPFALAHTPPLAPSRSHAAAI